MTKIASIVTAIAGAALLVVSTQAQAAVTVGDVVGKTEAEVRTQLEAAGYTVNEIEVERDEIEAEVTLDGVALEIEIDPTSGAVTEVEADD